MLRLSLNENRRLVPVRSRTGGGVPEIDHAQNRQNSSGSRNRAREDHRLNDENSLEAEAEDRECCRGDGTTRQTRRSPDRLLSYSALLDLADASPYASRAYRRGSRDRQDYTRARRGARPPGARARAARGSGRGSGAPTPRTSSRPGTSRSSASSRDELNPGARSGSGGSSGSARAACSRSGRRSTSARRTSSAPPRWKGG